MSQLVSVQIGVQWGWATNGIVFSPNAHSPNMGGNQRLIFPADRLIRAISWQSSVKVNSHEVLMHFMISPHGNGLGEEGEVNILSTHHVSNTKATMIVKDISFSDSHGILIPEGYSVWIYGEGGGIAHPAPVEVQTTLYLTN